jgi:hypothetical protein
LLALNSLAYRVLKIRNALHRLTLRLELRVLSRLGSVHHALHIEYVCKILVRVKRWVDWLNRFDRARAIYMVALLRQGGGLLLGRVHIPNIDVRAIVQIVWAETASTNILGESWILLLVIKIIATVAALL